MENTFDPWDSVLKGQQSADSLHQAQLRGMALRERLALKKAAGQLGSQNYFAGYEGVPGAERPDSIKDLWMNGDPDQAMKLEDFASQRFKLERGAEIAGKTEAARDAARNDAQFNMEQRFEAAERAAAGETYGGNVGNEMNTRLFGSSGTTTPFPGTIFPLVSGAVSPLAGLSATEKTREFGPQGYRYIRKTMSPFEQSMKMGEDTTRRETLDLAKAKEAREAPQVVTENIRHVTDQIKATQEAMQNHNVSWGEGQQQVQQLQAELQGFRQQRDAMIHGKTVPLAASPDVPGRGPARKTPPLVQSVQPPISSQSGRFVPNEKEMAELETQAMGHDKKEKLTESNLEIKKANQDALKTIESMPAMKELMSILQRTKVGHPELADIWGMTNLLSMNRDNAQVKRLNDALVSDLVGLGQSQMWNTIVETQMRGAKMPGLFTEPQLNRIFAATRMSVMEQAQKYPQFLEQWREDPRHHNTLTGASTAWIDYATYNPTYTYTKDQRGTVYINKKQDVMSPETWQTLREQNRIRPIGDEVFIKQHDGSWKKRP